MWYKYPVSVFTLNVGLWIETSIFYTHTIVIKNMDIVLTASYNLPHWKKISTDSINQFAPLQ